MAQESRTHGSARFEPELAPGDRAGDLRFIDGLSIFLGWLVAQLAWAMLISAIGTLLFAFAAEHPRDPQEKARELSVLVRLSALIVPDLALFSVLYVVWRRLRGQSAQPLRLELGLVAPSRAVSAIGALLGLLISASYCLFVAWHRDPTARLHTLFGGWGSAFQLLAMITWIPIGEEFLFRGYMFSVFRRSTSTAVSALCVTILFLLAHTDQIYSHPPVVFPLLGLSVGALSLRIHARSLLPAMLLHASYNAVFVAQILTGG